MNLVNFDRHGRTAINPPKRSVLIRFCALFCYCWHQVSAAPAADVPPDHAAKMARGLEMFRKEVRSLLVENCLECHGGAKLKGNFDLSTREGLLRLGDEGPAVTPFHAAGSRLVKLIRHEAEPNMPDKKPKLPEAAIAAIAQWIDLGAPYEEPLLASKQPRGGAVVSEADRKWWAFQPLANVKPPSGAAHPVDAFLLQASKARQLSFNPAASRRTLIRRASLDLIGLPPAPEEVEAFTSDKKPGAWERLVKRLLDSPHHGERWARHWLDVARFAESSGFEHDYDRPHAFHYRDFIIRALNADMPYDQFVRWQLAGDEFAPDNAEALMATGFLGAGVFPTQITANEVERTRYDALDDMLSTTGSAFLGLTIGCARCHDHKYDPIPSRDYYRMLSTFTTTVRANVDLELDPAAAARARKKFQDEQTQLETKLADYEKNDLPTKFDAWLASGAELPLHAASLLEVTNIVSKAGATFQKLDDGSWLAAGRNGASDLYTVTATTSVQRITGLKLEALTDASLKKKGPGRADNGNFALSRITVTGQPMAGGETREAKPSRVEATHEQNKTSLSAASSLDEDPKTGWAVDMGGIGKDQAAVFAFAEPLTFEGGAKLTVKLEFSVNAGHNIGRARFSVFSENELSLKSDVVPATVATLARQWSDPEKRAPLDPASRAALLAWWKSREPGWRALLTGVEEHRKKAPKTKTPVLICAEGYDPLVMHSQGAPFFQQTHVLRRGDANQKQEVAEQGFLQVLMRNVDEKRWQWSPPAGAPYSGRRRSLANWLTDVEQGGGALLARVAVNRLWQHHFGRGLVATPSDFGRTGAAPSHPELLDWLAGELIRHGWRLKPIHELLMTSAAYQQNTMAAAAKVKADPDNALFLRRVPQRLEAEAVRDSALAASGLLDSKMFGPGTLDEDSKRRSIYFMVKRSRLMNSMVMFDAPEPLVSQGTRPTTTVAPQALLLLNSPQARGWAQAMARRLEAEVKNDTAGPAPRIARGYQIALGRPPTRVEASNAATFVERGVKEYSAAGQANAHALALADFCQALLGLNEFIYVD
jgi:mono/diheme cytochrome c family protein